MLTIKRILGIKAVPLCNEASKGAAGKNIGPVN
jgi:hypothetical protein